MASSQLSLPNILYFQTVGTILDWTGATPWWILVSIYGTTMQILLRIDTFGFDSLHVPCKGIVCTSGLHLMFQESRTRIHLIY